MLCVCLYSGYSSFGEFHGVIFSVVAEAFVVEIRYKSLDGIPNNVNVNQGKSAVSNQTL